MDGLNTLTEAQVTHWMEHAKARTIQGTIIDRIPQLARANPRWLAVHIRHQAGQIFQGDTACMFPLMSVIKPFVLLYLLEWRGAEAVFQWVGTEPSDAPFNSLEQLVADRGRPRNPMINSGAIALADKLPGKTAIEQCQQFCQWLNQLAGCELHLDEGMLVSVRSTGREANQTIVRYLAKTGYLQNPGTALDIYEQICCLSGNIADLSSLGALLASERGLVAPKHRRIVNALMLTCGLYSASGAFAVRIGLPMKSGISGALLAVVPNQGTIACYSPALDTIGNSIAGLTFVETVAQALQLSVFG